ncbi:MAG: permease-like cell division protein FtsX [Dysgonamonadaceae bacterium]|jgi:cell division transport system permease protein|nr:permease-like cell division protein FtsX [Dysgonamonadaceae bacterium]
MKGKSIINKTAFINSKITSTISISLVLFLLGIIVLLSSVTQKLATYVKENMSFSIVLADDMKEADIKKLQRKIDSSPYTKSTEYKTKEQAVEEMTAELGENPETFLGFNPFLASIEVKLNAEYANNDSIAAIEKELKEVSNIGDITYRKDLLDTVNNNIRKINLVLIALTGLLLFISFALISNTIRLMIYSKRFLIHTMKLVGASNSFIRKPFIYSNILTGILAAVIAMGLLLCLVYYGLQGLSGLSGLIDIDSLIIVFGIISVSGILISTIATYFAVNKYLKLKVDDLYHI